MQKLLKIKINNSTNKQKEKKKRKPQRKKTKTRKSKGRWSSLHMKWLHFDLQPNESECEKKIKSKIRQKTTT